MNARMNRLAIFAAAAIVALAADSVLAALSIGVPAGRPYFGSSGRNEFRSNRGYVPSYSAPVSESRQSFSYEPGESGEQPAASGGCCCGSHAAAPSESHDVAQNDAAKSDDASRQSFSYEPAAPDEDSVQRPIRRSMSRSTDRRDAWQYQKTDPRRNQ